MGKLSLINPSERSDGYENIRNIAHDLRSPFSGIFGFSNLITKEIEQGSYDKLYEYNNRIYQSAEKAFDLLNNLLQWSRIQIGHIEFKPEPIKLQEIITRNTNLLDANINEKQIKLTLNIEANLQFNADTFMLETVIRNLLSNAIKYTQKGGFIKISALHTNKNIRISVIDNGVGISKGDLDKLFKIEGNHSTAGTNNESGTGLGLILCKEFIEKHSGKIWAESEVGKGSSFIFTLPVV